MPSDIYRGDEQDQAEVFDEDNYADDAAGVVDGEMRTFEELPDVLDVTRAAGDADDDAAAFAEDLDDDEIIALESDSDATDIEDDELAARMPEAFDEDDADDLALAGDGSDPDDGMNRASADEVEIRFIPNGDDVTNEEEDEVTGLEASGELSDEQVRELGYGMARRDADQPQQGSGASADDVAEENHPRQEDLLDEGIEETFPASDPVSVKRIT